MVALLIAAGGWFIAYQNSPGGWIRADGAAGLVRLQINGDKQWLSWSRKGATTTLTRYRELAGLMRDHETLDLAEICNKTPCQIPIGDYRLVLASPVALPRLGPAIIGDLRESNSTPIATDHSADVYWLDKKGAIVMAPPSATKSCRSEMSKASWIVSGRDQIQLRYYCPTRQFAEPDTVQSQVLYGGFR